MKWIDRLKEYRKDDIERLERDVFKTWQVTYCGHYIRIDNFLDEEKLYVNGELRDHKRRTHPLGRFIPYQTLQTKIHDNNGELFKIHVTVGGFLTLNCTVKINETIILKDKVRIPIF